jgi:hypothetical protein
VNYPEFMHYSRYKAPTAIPPARANANAGNGAAVIIAFEEDLDEVEGELEGEDPVVVAPVNCIVVPPPPDDAVVVLAVAPLPDRVAPVAEPTSR